MSETQTGYGPPGPRYPFQLFVHQIKPSSLGTELTLILDDGGAVAQLLVCFPPSDQEWRNKFLTVLDHGPPPLRSATVVAPPGASIASFRCLDAHGEPISYLCCMFRIVQGDWLDDVAPAQNSVPELMASESNRSDQEDMNSRLYVEAGGSTCCICGNIVRTDQGYAFKQLGEDTVRAIRLESALAKNFPFVCFHCYSRKFGSLSVQALGSVSAMEGRFAHFLLVFLRGYILAMMAWNVSRRPTDDYLMVAAFMGAFVPFERIPGLFWQAMKSPFFLLAFVFIPVMGLLFGALRWDITSAIIADPRNLWFHLGMTNVRFAHFGVAKASAFGSLAGLLIGHVFGFLGGGSEDEK